MWSDTFDLEHVGCRLESQAFVESARMGAGITPDALPTWLPDMVEAGAAERRPDSFATPFRYHRHPPHLEKAIARLARGTRHIKGRHPDKHITVKSPEMDGAFVVITGPYR